MHKPSDRERYWFRNLLTALLGVYSVQKVIGLWADGSIMYGVHFVEAKVFFCWFCIPSHKHAIFAFWNFVF